MCKVNLQNIIIERSVYTLTSYFKSATILSFWFIKPLGNNFLKCQLKTFQCTVDINHKNYADSSTNIAFITGFAVEL